jgi:hypothetical protein
MSLKRSAERAKDLRVHVASLGGKSGTYKVCAFVRRPSPPKICPHTLMFDLAWKYRFYSFLIHFGDCGVFSVFPIVRMTYDLAQEEQALKERLNEEARHRQVCWTKKKVSRTHA